jgi:hypothetical protein
MAKVQIDGRAEWEEQEWASARLNQMLRERRQLKADGKTDQILTDEQISEQVWNERLQRRRDLFGSETLPTERHNR